MDEYIQELAQLNEVKVSEVSLEDPTIIAGLIFLYSIDHPLSIESVSAAFLIDKEKVQQVMNNLENSGYIKGGKILLSKNVDYKDQFLLFSMAGTGKIKVNYE